MADGSRAEPEGEIFLDVNPRIGFAPGVRWKSELARAVDRCEAVICLISPDWEKSGECVAEARLAESLNKRVFCARIDPAAQGERIREWQICDLFTDGHGEQITVTSDDGEPVVFSADGLARLLRGLRDAGIGAEYFPWPPEEDSKRVPYRGWQSMEDADAAVFFGRDPQILRGLDALRGMRATGVESLFVILGPSGVGKSSFLRAGLLPRLRRDHRNFLVADIVRPERAAVTGDHGLAQAIWQLRSQAGPGGPALGDVKAACLHADTARLTAWLREAQRDAAGEGVTPTLVLPIDQGEELFSADAGPEASACLALLGALLQAGAIDDVPLIAVMTIRADRYQSLQEAPELLGVHSREFGDLKPMPLTEYKDVITGPAERATAAGLRLDLDPALVARAARRCHRRSGQPAAARLDALTAVSGLRQHRTAHAGQLRGDGRNGAHRRGRDRQASGHRSRPPSTATRHPARRVHSLAGHGRPRHRCAVASGRELERAATGKP